MRPLPIMQCIGPHHTVTLSRRTCSNLFNMALIVPCSDLFNLGRTVRGPLPLPHPSGHIRLGSTWTSLHRDTFIFILVHYEL